MEDLHDDVSLQHLPSARELRQSPLKYELQREQNMKRNQAGLDLISKGPPTAREKLRTRLDIPGVNTNFDLQKNIHEKKLHVWYVASRQSK
jgi:hypothetical protein